MNFEAVEAELEAVANKLDKFKFILDEILVQHYEAKASVYL